MVQIPTTPENQILLLNLPLSIGLYVIQQFAILAVANRDLKLERNPRGELIVNPPTGWEIGQRNLSISGQLYRWYEENENLGKAFDSSTDFILPNGATRFQYGFMGFSRTMGWIECRTVLGLPV